MNCYYYDHPMFADELVNMYKMWVDGRIISPS
jgi:hypothetical protein